MDFDALVKKRKSVRNFTSKTPKWSDVLEAIDSSLQGPFAGNQNNLHFLIIEDEEKISKIAEHCSQRWIDEAKILVLICTDDTHLENLYGERGRIYSRQQAGAAIQTFLLKLVDLGLCGCWVGAYSDELIRSYLKIPQHIQIEAIIPIGYEKKVPSSKSSRKKKSLESSIFWERWDQRRRPSLFEAKEEYHPD
jgi:nitroreductase